MCVCISCSCSFFSFLCFYSSHMSEYTGQKSEAFRYLFKRISLLSCFFMFIFLLFFSFLLIGEKVNTQWLSHAIFDPVVSWSYFLSFVLFHDFFFVFFVCVACFSVCIVVVVVTWMMMVGWFSRGGRSRVGLVWELWFLFIEISCVCDCVCVSVLCVNVLLLCSVVVAVKGLVLFM